MNFKYIILIISIFLINKFNCVDLSTTDLQCIQHVGTITQDPNIIVSTVQSTYCSIPFVICDSNGSIIKLVINAATPTDVLAWTDLQCFSKLNELMFRKVNVSTDFLYSIPSNIKRIVLRSSNLIEISSNVSPLDNLGIDSLPDNYLLYSSYLSKVNIFSTMSTVVDFQVNDAQNNGNFLTSLTIKTNNIPNISNLLNLNTIDLTIDVNFIPTSVSNFKSWSRIKTLTFNNNLKIDFPFELFESNQVLTSFGQIGLGFNTPYKFIDLSKLPKGFSLSISNPGDTFNINGQLPFSAFPDESSITIRNGNFSKPSVSVIGNIRSLTIQNSINFGSFWATNTFKKVNSIDLSGNQMTGTISKEWCGMQSLKVTNNLLSGDLPDCIYCYLNDSSVSSRFSGNSFTNYNPGSVTCGHSEVSLTFGTKVGSTQFNITGKNLGTTINNFVSTPSIFMSNYISKDYFTGFFTGSLVDVKTAEVRILIPGINFTVSISQTPPIIDSIIQTNNSFLFTGSFFSYVETDISVTIGGTVCNVLPLSSFYNFTCELNWPIRRINAGDKPVIAQVGTTLKTTSNVLVTYTPVPCPVADCNGNGLCNDDIGVCLCNNKWTTVGNNICNVPNQYIYSTTQVPLSTGGKLKLLGYIGNQNVGLKVTIDYNNTAIGLELPLLDVNEGYIETEINPSLIGGAKKLTISQNGVTWFGLIYPYIETTFLCPNNCGNSKSGTCNSTSGNCICNPGYNGIDCRTFVSGELPPNKTKVNSTGVTTISNEQTGYQLSIVSISEIDFNGIEVSGSKFSLLNSWVIVDSSNDNISIFKQNINNATIILTIEQIVNQDKQFSFAGNQFTVLKDGIKITLSISNWTYKSSLNNIQIQMQSDLTVLNGGETDCNQNNNQLLVESSSNRVTLDNNINYLKITKNNKVLYGRFQDKVLSNDIPTIVTTTLISKDDKTVLLGLNLPHCDTCVIDPDFSVLVTDNFKSPDSCSSSSKPWLIPVAVVVPVVAVALIITVIIVLVKKNSIGLRVGLRNISLKSLKDGSKK